MPERVFRHVRCLRCSKPIGMEPADQPRKKYYCASCRGRRWG